VENYPKRPTDNGGGYPYTDEEELEPAPYQEEYDAWFSSLTPEQQQAVLARDKRIAREDGDEDE
jgi:hypothetical protein